MIGALSQGGARITTPELPLVLFGFLLHFLWEMWQVPFFVGMASAAHWEVVWACTQATFGDVGILLLAYWAAAATTRSRWWLLAGRNGPFFVYIGTGLAITVVIEAVSTDVLERWSYVEPALVLPVLGTGAAPLLQWLLLPVLVLTLTRYHLLGVLFSGHPESPVHEGLAHDDR